VLTVNCAGIATGMKTVSRKRDTGEIKPHDMAQFERTVRVNLFGTFRVLSQSAAGMFTLEPMEDGERGLIVNTASVAAQDGQVGQAAYSASKGGVYAMTLPIARDLAQDGIRCNTILPGIMWTPMMAGMEPEDPGRPGRPRSPSPAVWASPRTTPPWCWNWPATSTSTANASASTAPSAWLRADLRKRRSHS